MTKHSSFPINEKIPNETDPITSFTNIQTEIAKQITPKSFSKSPHKTNSWLTAEFRETIKSREKMLNMFKHNPTKNNLQKY